jgi:hypothetical protein
MIDESRALDGAPSSAASATLPAPRATRLLLLEDASDSLAPLGAELLDLGFEVAVASDPRVSLDPTSTARFDILLVAEEALRALGPEVGALLRQRSEPHLVLVSDAATAWADNEVSRADAHVIAQRVARLVREREQQATSFSPGPSDGSGTLAPGWLLPLVSAFAGERVTGALTVTTTDGAGELRFARGELVDAVYSQLEGLKAFFRLALEKEGTWQFTEASSLVMRRITVATAELLRMAPAELSRVDQARSALGNLDGSDLYVEPGAVGPPLAPFVAAVAARLSAPRPLDALLDESPELDTELFAALLELDKRGLLKRVRTSARAVVFDSPSLIDRVLACATRSVGSGFRGSVRIVLACAPTSLSLLAHATSRLEEAISPTAPAPDAPVPYELASLCASEDAWVVLIALPLDVTGSPLWPLVIAGALAVVVFDEKGSLLLSDLCETSGVVLLSGASIVPALDPGNHEHIAALVRVALGAERP